MDKIASNPAGKDAAKAKGKPVGAVINAAKILRLLRHSQGPATVTQITRAVKINPSTCFNILRTLIRADFVQFDETAKTYKLSLGLVALARGALEHIPELHLLKPKIEELARTHRMMVTIWRKIAEDRIMLVAVAESDAPVRIHARAGTRSPLLLGASGRVFTAYSGISKTVLKERFQELRLARPLDFDAYLQQLEEVRRMGWALDDGYAYAGTITIAAPVHEPGGALNFTCAAILFNGQYDIQRIAAIAEDLKRIGNTLIEAAPPAVAPTPEPVAKPKPAPAVKLVARARKARSGSTRRAEPVRTRKQRATA